MTFRYLVQIGLAAGVASMLGGGVVVASDGGDEAQKVKKIIIEKNVECEGEECEELQMSAHSPEACEHCVKHRKMMMGGAPSEGDGAAIHGHPECEHGDCEKLRRVMVIGGPGGHAVHHGDSHHAEWFGGEGGGHHHGVMGRGGFLGIQMTELTDDLRSHFGVPVDRGVMIGKIVVDSAAEQAGLEVGDIIGAVNGQPVASPSALAHAVAALEPGASAELETWRQGASQTVTVLVGERAHEARPFVRTMVVTCEEGDEECVGGELADLEALGCGEGEECKVKVTCKNDECTCVVNDESVDCEGLNLPHHVPSH